MTLNKQYFEKNQMERFKLVYFCLSLKIAFCVLGEVGEKAWNITLSLLIMDKKQKSFKAFIFHPERVELEKKSHATVPWSDISTIGTLRIIQSRAPEPEPLFLGPRLKTEATRQNLVALHKSLQSVIQS